MKEVLLGLFQWPFLDLYLPPVGCVYLYFLKVYFSLAPLILGYEVFLITGIFFHLQPCPPGREIFQDSFFFSLSLPLSTYRTHGYNCHLRAKTAKSLWKPPRVLVYCFYRIPFLGLLHTGRARLSDPRHYFATNQIIFVCSFWNNSYQFFPSPGNNSKSLELMEWSLYQIAHIYRSAEWSEFWCWTTKVRLSRNPYNSSDAYV